MGRWRTEAAGEAGFSLVEGVGYLIVFTILMGALTFAMGGLFGGQAQPAVAYASQTYARAPSFDGFHRAVALQQAFSGAVDAADSVIVLGGTRSHPAFDPTGPSAPLDTGFADPTLDAMTGGDGFQAYSSWDQRVDNNSQFTPYLAGNAAPDPADFTILTVQGLSRITSITQQRRHQAVVDGRSLSLYEVTHQTIDWSSGSPAFVPGADTNAPPTYAYRFFYAAAEDVWAMPPGATHTWYRTDTTWNRDQEGPTRVVFADPCALAGQDPNAALLPISQFVYFIPQLR